MRHALGLSPCPNDTFIFHALLHGLVASEYADFEPVFADVQKLNEMAISGRLPVTKVSAGVLPHILDKYRVLSSGAALGWGCGPLVVAKSAAADPRSGRVAIPGRNTTASLLLDLNGRFQGERLEMRFDQIMTAVATGEADFGVIIHEGRFTYQEAGLIKLLDLGEWWEEKYNMPLPLGAIVIRRDIEAGVAQALERAIAASVEYAWQNPEASRDFIHSHSQELDPDVTRAHIETFVTRYSADLGADGRDAITRLISGQLARMRMSRPLDIFAS